MSKIKYEEIIRPYMEQGAALGTAVAVLQNGHLAYAGGFGTTSVEDGGVPVNEKTLFAYGSISKTFCAMLIMRLVEEGLLDLDRPIVNYLPKLTFKDAKNGPKVTLRHLLSHTSGLPMAGKYWGPRHPESLGESVIEQVSQYDFLSAPGQLHLYANTVICTAGYVAEAVTGKFYDELVQEYLFDPLQMNTATFDPAVVMTYPLAQAHYEEDGDLKVVHRMPFNVSGNPSGFSYGSVLDLANYAQMILNDGRYDGAPFLSLESIVEMHQPYGHLFIEGAAHPFSQMNTGYGLGFQVGHYKGIRSVRHGGMNLSNNCFFDLFPDENTAVITLTNYCNDPVLMEMICALYDEALGIEEKGLLYHPKPESVEADPAELKNYCGLFLCVEFGQLVNVKLSNGTLKVKVDDNEREMVPIGNGRFYTEVTPTFRQMIQFVHKPNGDLDYMMMSGAPYHPWSIEDRIDTSNWPSWVGLYRDPTNHNPKEVIDVVYENDVLYFSEDGEESEGQAIGSATFLTHIGLVEFAFDEQERPYLTIGKATRYFKS